jgi:radical SAM protein with 4Fe4S-binding SPASM domain
VDTLNYGAFSAALQGRLGGLRVPLNGTIEVTRRCPLTCLHCYNNLPMNDHEARDRELTLAEHCRLLDELADAGCLWLLYTGGEIFARRDFLDIYTYAKRKGFLITLFTNGTLITEAIADRLVQLPPFAIEITLYGYTAATYEALTGIPGSHAKCLRGIRNLLDRKLPLALKTVAVSTNRHEIAAMQRFADELDVEFKFDSDMSPRLDCSQAPLDVRLRPEEAVALDLEFPKRRDEWVQFAEHLSGARMPPLDEVYQCGGGMNAFAVDAYGRLSICVLSEAHKYDLRQGSFRDGWESFLGQQRLKKVTRPTKCVGCQLKSMCGMCPANAELENGDPETPVEYLCRVAHLRAMTLGIPIQAHGSCEYCAGGSGYADLVASAERLRSGHGPFERERAVAEHEGKLFLRMADAAARSGCSSCGSH